MTVRKTPNLALSVAIRARMSLLKWLPTSPGDAANL